MRNKILRGAMLLSVVCAMTLQADPTTSTTSMMDDATSATNANPYAEHKFEKCDFNSDGAISEDEKKKCIESKKDDLDFDHDLDFDDAKGPKDFSHFSFQPDQEVGDCKPGEECDAVIVGADDYFSQPDLPGSSSQKQVMLFSKDDVDKIINKCKNNPKACGIETGFSDKVTDVNSILPKIEGKDVPIAGYYLHYGSGSYDWLYMDPKATYVFKLEEGLKKDGSMRWTPVKGFDAIIPDPTNGVVHFGQAEDISTNVPTVPTTATTSSVDTTTVDNSEDTAAK